jgi:hypothetical protein
LKSIDLNILPIGLEIPKEIKIEILEDDENAEGNKNREISR